MCGETGFQGQKTTDLGILFMHLKKNISEFCNHNLQTEVWQYILFTLKVIKKLESDNIYCLNWN